MYIQYLRGREFEKPPYQDKKKIRGIIKTSTLHKKNCVMLLYKIGGKTLQSTLTDITGTITGTPWD